MKLFIFTVVIMPYPDMGKVSKPSRKSNHEIVFLASLEHFSV